MINGAVGSVEVRILTLGLRSETFCIEASWKWIDAIVKLWESEDVPMEEYISGTWGPSSSEIMLSKENRKWANKNQS